MTDLFFLRHGPRADFATSNDPPIYPDYTSYDPLVTISTVGRMGELARQICSLVDIGSCHKKNIYVHFSPYLRCCQSADLLTTALQKEVAAISDLKPRFHLLGDFALSEWIHDNMKNPPPFVDSNEAYQMYTPNVRLLENRKMCLNFRPTTKLGPWNEPGLLFKDFLSRCRDYLQKLLATYDKPAHSGDMVVVITHGYVVSNMLSCFVSHPIFEEIPELGLNHAKKDDQGSWTLKQDCLGLLEKENLDGHLNLELDIIYYKTNFIKKDELNEAQQYPAIGFGGLRPSPNENDPRPSFKVQLQDHKPLTVNPLCPSAKDWDPRHLRTFRVKSEFAIKVMHDEAFKKAFDLSNPPTHPVSPEVSPGSEPARANSTVDLLKLRLNEEIYHPFKLRYSLASDIPVQQLNLKVNSHVSLALIQRGGHNSNDNSALDLLRSTIFGPQPHSGVLSGGLGSPRDEVSDIESTNMNDVIQRLSRVRSLQRRRAQSTTPKFGKIAENEVMTSPGPPENEKHFSLQFGSPKNSPPESESSVLSLGHIKGTSNTQLSHTHYNHPQTSHSTSQNTHPTQFGHSGRDNETHHVPRRRRSSSVKFVPSMLIAENRKKLSQLIFYNLASDSSSSASDEEVDENQIDEKYRWFGGNASP